MRFEIDRCRELYRSADVGIELLRRPRRAASARAGLYARDPRRIEAPATTCSPAGPGPDAAEGPHRGGGDARPVSALTLLIAIAGTAAITWRCWSPATLAAAAAVGPAPASAPAPRLSVVVPARDEAGNIAALLGSLAASNVVPHEVLVVDDGSTDATRGARRRGGGDGAARRSAARRLGRQAPRLRGRRRARPATCSSSSTPTCGCRPVRSATWPACASCAAASSRCSRTTARPAPSSSSRRSSTCARWRVRARSRLPGAPPRAGAGRVRPVPGHRSRRLRAHRGPRRRPRLGDRRRRARCRPSPASASPCRPSSAAPTSRTGCTRAAGDR